MKRLGLCLLVSLTLHVLFFPGFLHGMLTSGAADQAPKTPPRTKIRMVTKAKKPEPAPVVKAPIPERPKPKVVREKPPEPKPQPRTPERQRPAERPRRVAERPQERPRPRSERPASRPRTTPRDSGKTSSPPANSRQRLTRSDNAPSQPNRGPATLPPASEDSGGRTGYLPNNGQNADANGTDFHGSTDNNGNSQDSGPATGQGGDPGPASDGGSSTSPDQDTDNNNTGSGKEGKNTGNTDDSKRNPDDGGKKEKPKMAREANVSVPGAIKLPASLRRDAVNLSLQVRVVIGPDGSADFKLGESCGNPEADDFILAELRKNAQVVSAIDEQGQPKRAMKRVTVKIEVD